MPAGTVQPRVHIGLKEQRIRPKGGHPAGHDLLAPGLLSNAGNGPAGALLRHPGTGRSSTAPRRGKKHRVGRERTSSWGNVSTQRRKVATSLRIKVASTLLSIRVCGPLMVLCRQGVIDGGMPSTLAPRTTRWPAGAGLEPGPGASAAGDAQQVGKEAMIAIPAPLVVQGHDEEVGRFQRFQARLAIWRPAGAVRGGSRCAKLANFGFSESTASQRGPLNRSRIEVWSRNSWSGRWLLVQNLFHQIVENKAVAAGECLDEFGLRPPRVPGATLAQHCPAWRGPPSADRRSSPRCGLPGRQRPRARDPGPITWFRKAAASLAVKRRSIWRSSVNCPRARRRARGRGGSERVARTRCMLSGR